MTMTMASPSSSPWLYFAAGVLLPTIAFVLTRSGTKQVKRRRSDDEESSSSSSDDEDLHGIETTGPSSQWGMMDCPYKLLLCVNQELSMGKGKIAAQCCHAAVGCYKRASKQCPNAVAAWERTGCAKIAVKCPSQEELERIAVLALERDIPMYLVEDAGRTQIAAGSRTVLGLGPAPVYSFEGVTSHLKLM